MDCSLEAMAGKMTPDDVELKLGSKSILITATDFQFLKFVLFTWALDFELFEPWLLAGCYRSRPQNFVLNLLTCSEFAAYLGWNTCLVHPLERYKNLSYRVNYRKFEQKIQLNKIYLANLMTRNEVNPNKLHSWAILIIFVRTKLTPKSKPDL